jgi:hypothetical protein
VPQIAVTMASQIRNALRYFDMDFPAGRRRSAAFYPRLRFAGIGFEAAGHLSVLANGCLRFP